MLRGLARRGWTHTRRSATAVLVVGVVPCLFGAAPVAAAQTTALAVHVGTPARAVHGSDGREHVDYDLVITNAFTVPVRLESLRVFSAGRYVLPRHAPARSVIGSTVVHGPTVRVDRGPPVRIASPVYGAGWLNSNGCCADPTSEHRTLLLPANGSFRTPEMFAIDWIREVGGSFYTGDGRDLTDWPGFGVPIHAVANGVVVSVVKDRPEVPPFTTTDKNPTVRRPRDFAGNLVVERIAPGKYAAYAHLQTGSVRVRVGQRLRTGQVIGLLGNTGNTTGPHLHFGIQDGRDVLTSDSLTFEVRSFTVQGTAALRPRKPGAIILTGKPRRVAWSQPLIRSVDSL